MVVESPPTALPADRSRFVTRVARWFIMASASLAMLTLMQMVMQLAPFLPAQARSSFAARDATQVWVVLGGALVLCLLTLTVSLGLLQRKRWARRAFNQLLAVGVVLNVARLVVSGTATNVPPLEADSPTPFVVIVRLAQTLDVVVPLVLIAVFVGLFIAFNSSRVRDEFGG